MCVFVYSLDAESADVPCEASAEDTTATLSIGVPADTEAAAAGVTEKEVPGEGITPAFLGATTTLLQRHETNKTFICDPNRTRR